MRAVRWVQVTEGQLKPAAHRGAEATRVMAEKAIERGIKPAGEKAASTIEHAEHELTEGTLKPAADRVAEQAVPATKQARTSIL